MKPEHKRMSRMLGYCLALGTYEAWSSFSLVAAVRLSAAERASLAFSALKAQTHSQAEATATAAIRSAGSPLPPFLNCMDEAREWAAFASRNELKAFALAAHDAMSAEDQMAFRQFISEVEIAA